MSNLKKKLLGSSAWLTSEYFIEQALRLASNVIIARILFPEAFGVMALVQVFLQGMEMLSDVGIRGAIIKSQNRDDRTFLDTAWTIQVLRGLILVCIAIPLAPMYASSFNEPQLTNLIICSAAINIINCIAPTKAIMAGIAMKHKMLVLIRLSAAMCATFATIVSALITESVWCFVFGAFIGTSIRTLLLYTVIPGPLNRFSLNKESTSEILGFSVWVFISSAAMFGLNQVDKIIVGGVLGVEALGLYNVAFFIASAPQLLFQSINSRVGQPLHSPRSNTPVDSVRKFQIFSVSACSLTLIFLGFTSAYIIDFLYDENYTISTQIAPFVALSLPPSILVASYTIGLLAKGHSRQITYIMLFKFALQLPLLYVLTKTWNLFGMILALPLAELVTYIAVQYYVRKYSHHNTVFDGAFLAIWLAASLLLLFIYAPAVDILKVYQ